MSLKTVKKVDELSSQKYEQDITVPYRKKKYFIVRWDHTYLYGGGIF